MKKETICVHAGSIPDTVLGGINSPIFTSSAIDYRQKDEPSYPRYFNTPNQQAVIDKVCALEGAQSGILFSSGMAAISTSILAFAGAGDHVVMQEEIYGGTLSFALGEFERLGIDVSLVPTDAEKICNAVSDKTRVMVLESPTNPLLHLIDIKRICDETKKRGIVTIMDNTFATPINQTPIQFGIDVVVHSGTKYLGGHSDLCCGVAVSTKEKTKRILALAKNLGGSLNAASCYLLERSLKTLCIRVERQTDNAGRIAEYLHSHELVKRTFYPGLPGFTGHEIARAQMKGFGAMVSFELDTGLFDIDLFLNSLRLIQPAVSLGGVESTICVPAETSHAKVPEHKRIKTGITAGLLRLSVGIEHPDDLIDDLENALTRSKQRP